MRAAVMLVLALGCGATTESSASPAVPEPTVEPPEDRLRIEAEDWLSELATQQDAHRAEFGDFFPREGPNEWTPRVETWSTPSAWEVSFREGERTALQLRVWAGPPGANAPVPMPESARSDFWYVLRARADDGRIFQRTSWSQAIEEVEPLP